MDGQARSKQSKKEDSEKRVEEPANGSSTDVSKQDKGSPNGHTGTLSKV